MRATASKTHTDMKTWQNTASDEVQIDILYCLSHQHHYNLDQLEAEQ